METEFSLVIATKTVNPEPPVQKTHSSEQKLKSTASLHATSRTCMFPRQLAKLWQYSPEPAPRVHLEQV